MTFQEIDSIIYGWASDNGLRVDTEYQETEVRSVYVLAADGRKAQIWIDFSKRKGVIDVRASDLAKRSCRFSGTLVDLRSNLDSCLEAARRWNSILADSAPR